MLVSRHLHTLCLPVHSGYGSSQQSTYKHLSATYQPLASENPEASPGAVLLSSFRSGSHGPSLSGLTWPATASRLSQTFSGLGLNNPSSSYTNGPLLLRTVAGAAAASAAGLGMQQPEGVEGEKEQEATDEVRCASVSGVVRWCAITIWKF